MKGKGDFVAGKPPPLDQVQGWLTEGAALTEAFALPQLTERQRPGTGEHLTRAAGGSLEFQDHRPYFPGDDLRHINWQVYARSGRYVQKVYQAEMTSRLDVAVELSPSAFLDEAKAHVTFAMTAFCLHAGWREGYDVRLWETAPQLAREVSLEHFRAGSWSAELVVPKALPTAPPWDSIPWRKEARRIVIADLLFPEDPSGWSRLLAREASSLLVIAPGSREEARPAVRGNVEVRCVESAQQRAYRFDEVAYTQYIRRYEAHFLAWEEALARIGATLWRVSTDEALSASMNAAVAQGWLEVAR